METTTPSDQNALLRRSLYAILICIGLGAMIGRILAVDSVDFRRAADAKFKKELDGKRKELNDKRVEIQKQIEREAPGPARRPDRFCPAVRAPRGA